ncbi:MULTISPECIES: HK97-gp10 family putative phage morphogenesis protein [Inquilinus]|uniref:HK97 gp10 family phage protein n=1 Tax=Inquilinus ginsengisoli TaxID=363840 RepID=A0ABU1JR28_9PROT|nr:HK97-gp10 family putative phage morphogenesis protein [Inquilinus ginsengisoli]MDR6289999.1 HK97 gp10 family phage protein [Inquilinus ginsengisoli]
MAHVTGADRHIRRLKRIGQTVRTRVGQALVPAAELVAAEAVTSITIDAVRGPGHVPSQPGEPPNADTGRLEHSIAVERRGELAVDVVAAAPYAADLEFGTSRVAARPYLRPATAKKRMEVVERIVQAARRGVEDA